MTQLFQFHQLHTLQYTLYSKSCSTLFDLYRFWNRFSTWLCFGSCAEINSTRWTESIKFKFFSYSINRLFYLACSCQNEINKFHEFAVLAISQDVCFEQQTSFFSVTSMKVTFALTKQSKNDTSFIKWLIHILDLNFNLRYTVVLCSIVGAPLDCTWSVSLGGRAGTTQLTKAQEISEDFFLVLYFSKNEWKKFSNFFPIV